MISNDRNRSNLKIKIRNLSTWFDDPGKESLMDGKQPGAWLVTGYIFP
jgi:hypothetical protein